MAIHQEYRILIVDDSFRNLSLMQRLLKSWGYSNCSVNSTEHTLNRLKHDRFDLIIVDKVLSSMKELDLAKKIRKIQPSTPVICSAREDFVKLKPKTKTSFRPFQKLRPILKQAVENRDRYGIIFI